ncbi:AAEL005196-PA [Aedes aegypti]|uniref:AAEL005196-PA n=1 Tax=Aedes aegypti TaxID=7159 RepID=Q17AR8_AEDAE|nr:AAEL005196-PA [Aedes aegypti]
MPEANQTLEKSDVYTLIKVKCLSVSKFVAVVTEEEYLSQMLEKTALLVKWDFKLAIVYWKKSSNLGISLVGGNANGIFVHGVQKDSIADNAGLRVGDQILEFNGTDLRRSTAEHAALEIAKPAENVAVLVFYNIQSKFAIQTAYFTTTEKLNITYNLQLD